MAKYSDKQYWENRYKEQENETYDWLEDFETLKPLIETIIINKHSKILILGCGNSLFSEKMYDSGWTNLYNIDISQNVIEDMKERNKLKNKMTYQVMDVRNLLFSDDYFDYIIDKSTIDVLFCGQNVALNIAIMLKEVQRVLKVKGSYLIVSFGSPENRSFHFERDHLSFEMKIFTLKKKLQYKEEKIEGVIINQE